MCLQLSFLVPEIRPRGRHLFRTIKNTIKHPTFSIKPVKVIKTAAGFEYIPSKLLKQRANSEGKRPADIELGAGYVIYLNDSSNAGVVCSTEEKPNARVLLELLRLDLHRRKSNTE